MFGALCVVLILFGLASDLFSGSGGRAGGAVVLLLIICGVLAHISNKQNKHDEEMLKLYRKMYPSLQDWQLKQKMYEEREYRNRKMAETERNARRYR